MKLAAPKTLVLAATLLCLPSIYAQQAPQKKASDPADDVVRINTELVQTDLTVVDKRGRFVEGLLPDQFVLSLDGKPQSISFFELIKTGSAREAAQLAAARGDRLRDQPAAVSSASDNGRIILFFLDDLHLSGASLIRARKALTEFIDNQMGQNDRVAVVSTSGQIGFLQQLSDYKPMLHAAIERLAYKKDPETYAGKVPISDYEATRVEDHNDRELFSYLLSATMNEFQSKGPLRRVAANMVKNRVRQISAHSKMVTNELLEVLESLMRSSAALPGRKLVFFMSEGFVADVRASNAMTLLQRVTDMAARSGIVVYTMDARGTFNDPMVDAGRNDFPDGLASGTQAKVPTFENAVMQEPLHILADDTGGRAIMNSNSFADAFQQAIDETSTYYLLAWRPDNDEQRNGKARIKVNVKDRPDLRIRLRRNYYAPPPAPAKVSHETDDPAPAAKTPEAELVSALGALYPQRTLATALSVGYLNTKDQGLVLKASMKLERSSLDLATAPGSKTEVDVVGAAVDDRGVIVTFKQVLTVTSEPSAQNQPVVWHQQLRVPPGLYQVRVALRERGSGRTGSAHQWIEVPNASAGQLQMSSLFLGERSTTAAEETTGNAPQPVMIEVDRRFARNAVLRFQTYIYNAAGSGKPVDVEIQARVLRDNRTVVTMPVAQLPADAAKDQARLPYWAELSLGQLPPGRYVLQVTANDRASKASTSQTVSFIVE
ncbi:MAG: hypothetical protein QOD75_3721 [Blastocatellia bacterium]|jgi:VWFA-related protein|nr:hypothetical protein [Blastocatellia bacterium]